MKRFMLPAGATLAAIAPAVAVAKAPTPAHVHAYEHVYREVAHRYGRRVPGRNIVKDGVAANRAATDAEVASSIAVLERMLVPGQGPASSSSSVATPTSTGSAGAGGVPACASESGTNYSTGPDNTNSSSGATGRYQILPSTAAAYGCSLATAAGQDACAQVIYEHQGAGAWVGCGG
jgi:Transglycosylase-like domain